MTGLGRRLAAGNPIIVGRGVTDPHIHVFDDTAYLYASHDKSPDNDHFVMEDWQVWSSTDLVSWELRSTLRPEHTYLAKTGGFLSAWATDATEKDGKYYWFFSNSTKEIGVVASESPIGPWHDLTGAPIITSADVETEPYDPSVFADGGRRYLLFGVWDYFIAELREDMTVLKEPPSRIEIIGAEGPYTHAAESPFAGRTTDDKPFLHRHEGLYYLSWGAFYATSTQVRGPYTYRGCVIDARSFPDGLAQPTWPHGPQQGRHGSFFEWHGQTYFAYCDMSQTGNRFYRDSFISYVHYRDDGAIAPIRVDCIGVGQYDGGRGVIHAQDYFAAEGAVKTADTAASGGFSVVAVSQARAALYFPNVTNAEGASKVSLLLRGSKGASTLVLLRADDGKQLGSVEATLGFGDFVEVELALARPFGAREGLTIEWGEGVGIDWIRLERARPRLHD